LLGWVVVGRRVRMQLSIYLPSSTDVLFFFGSSQERRQGIREGGLSALLGVQARADGKLVVRDRLS